MTEEEDCHCEERSDVAIRIPRPNPRPPQGLTHPIPRQNYQTLPNLVSHTAKSPE